MKIVLNRAVGASFCLSPRGLERLLQLKQQALNHDRHPSKLSETEVRDWSRLFPRDDADLVQVVEELGADAAGPDSELVIIDLPEVESWRVSDVVGYEFVEANGKFC